MSTGPPPTPAWRRRTPVETRWAAAAGTAAMVALQLSVPETLSVGPTWALPALEVVLLVVVVASATRLPRYPVPGDHRGLRSAALGLLVVAGVANAFSAVALVVGIVGGTFGGSAQDLLLGGGAVYLTNVLVFALAYWELDRGGPLPRAAGETGTTDFLFPQMTDGPPQRFSSPDWEPGFADYLYVSFTNATAFSPTDTLPLTRWAKLAMLTQSAVALVTVAMVVARAVNIL